MVNDSVVRRVELKFYVQKRATAPLYAVVRKFNPRSPNRFPLQIDLWPEYRLSSIRTGIFFHYQQGERLRDFPEALNGILQKNNVFLFDALYPMKPASAFDLKDAPLEAIYKVHSPELVKRVKATGNYEGALYSASGTLAAAVRIASGEITNAFVFTGYGDHHAGSHFFSGGCYFNGAAIAISELAETFGIKRFAIIDTDPHHGDGTWELFQARTDVLYVCFCSGPFRETCANVNINVPARTRDDHYLALLKESLNTHVGVFRPEIIFWNWGYDGTIGDYGDIGISPGLHPKLALEIKKLALRVCQGKLIVVLCGGSRRDLAKLLIPQIIRILADQTV